jgi:hypothetical protein
VPSGTGWLILYRYAALLAQTKPLGQPTLAPHRMFDVRRSVQALASVSLSLLPLPPPALRASSGESTTCRQPPVQFQA